MNPGRLTYRQACYMDKEAAQEYHTHRVGQVYEPSHCVLLLLIYSFTVGFFVTVVYLLRMKKCMFLLDVRPR